MRKAADWLALRQARDGALDSGDKQGYGHAIATAALCVLVQTGGRELEIPAKRAVAWLHEARNPGKAWRYTSRPGDNDTSVTGWVMKALAAAREAGLGYDKEAWRGALAWLDEVTDPSFFLRVGYNARGTGRVMVANKSEVWDHHETMTAIGVTVRIEAGQAGHPAIAEGLKMLAADPPAWGRASIDSVYWHHGTVALLKAEGRGGVHTVPWTRSLSEALAKGQVAAPDSCARGSVPSDDDRWGFEGGRVYATAINAMTLALLQR